MIEINKRNASMWSRIGIRAFYGQALSDIAAANPNVMAVSADLGRSSGLDRFSKEYPEQFLNSGIAEQNMVGVSAGLARMGAYNRDWIWQDVTAHPVRSAMHRSSGWLMR